VRHVLDLADIGPARYFLFVDADGKACLSDERDADGTAPHAQKRHLT
jgi:hypothetical protein